MIDTRTAPLGATALRVSLGVMWLAHGLLKLVVFSPAGFAGFLGSLGLPALLAWPIIIAEIGGGALLILGVYGRQVSLVLLPILIGALFTHAGNGWLFSAPGGGWEFPAFWIVASVAHALIGDGAYALRSTATLNPLEREPSRPLTA